MQRTGLSDGEPPHLYGAKSAMPVVARSTTPVTARSATPIVARRFSPGNDNNLKIGGYVTKRLTALALLFGGALMTSVPAHSEETPKHGGVLTYMIPADAPPSLDGHRETTYATVHAAAPFYSVLIRINPENPASPTDFVCDLCTEMPKPTDDGKTWTFKIRDGVKWHDGSPLTAADVAASWQEIIHPPPGVSSARESYFIMVDSVEVTDANTVVFHLKFATSAFLPALADPFAWIYKKEILDKDPHWYKRT